jgi:hypothetical protein
MTNISIKYGRVLPLLAAGIFILLSVDVSANEQMYKQYQQRKNELAAVQEEFEKAKVGYQSAKIDLDAASSGLDSLKSNVDAEKAKLDRLRDFEAQNPDMDFSDKINQQRTEWKNANQQYLTNKEYAKSLGSKVVQYQTQYSIAANKKKNLEEALQRISEDLADAQVREKLKQIQTSRRITISVSETCSLNVTKDQCRDQARVKAERQAAERGSLVVVESVTEIKNFNLTKDEARSRVSARVSNIEIIKDTYDLTADKSGWHVDYQINATVTPVITEQMRMELRQQAVSSLDAGYSPMSAAVPAPAPVNSSRDDSREAEKQKQKERQEAAQQQLESEMIARKQAEEELVKIKQQATVTAEKEVVRQATDEEKSRKRRVFGGW